MTNADDDNWLETVVQLQDGYEVEAVERFTGRLVRLAKSRMPSRLQRRLDPEDIVQSVFRSFFSRNEDGRFEFGEAADVWRLLAAITYRKVQRSIRFHHQQQRDLKQEAPSSDDAPPAQDVSPTASSLVVMIELLDGILEQIPETHREILQLRLEEYSIDEIAKKVGVSSRTVNRALALVRRIATGMIDSE